MQTESVVLACSWYPRGELGRFKRLLPMLRDIYADIVIAVFANTPETPIAQSFFTDVGIRHQVFDGWSGRHVCVTLAIEGDGKFVHYVDFDRLVRWAECFPDELKRVVMKISQQDLLILGRTPFAWETHPRSMFETEQLFNRVFSHYFGREMDFGAGSRGLSREAVKYILKNADSTDALSMDAGWSIMLKRAGFSWDYAEVDGLEYESADQNKDREATREEQQNFADKLDMSAENWALRTSVANKILASGLQVMTQDLT